MEEYNGEDDSSEKKVPSGVWIFHIVWITALGVGVAAIVLRDRQNKWLYIQSFISLLALIGVSIYTYLTRKMQQAMVHQTTISIMPLFEVVIRPRYGIREPYDISSDYTLELKNIGNGVALNIQIDPLFVEHWYELGVLHWDAKLWFQRAASLAPGSTPLVLRDIVDYDVATVRLKDEHRPDVLAYLTPKKAKRDYEMKVRFMDMLGNRYVQTIYIGKTGCWPGAAQIDKSQINRTSASS